MHAAVTAPQRRPGYHEQIRCDYENLWACSRSRLAEGYIEPDPASEETIKRWGVSAIFRPTGGVANTLASAAKDLAAHAGRRQVVYDCSNLHTTLRSVEFYRTEIGSGDEKIRAYVEVLRKVAERCDPLRVEYRGLTATATGVLAQGWPVGEGFQEMRHAFHRQLSAHGLLAGPEEVKLRITAHASLVVFTGPLLNPLSLVRHVKDNRHTYYGTAAYRFVDLVRYDRTPFEIKVVPMARIPLRI